MREVALRTDQVGFQIIGTARIENVGKSQSCMADQEGLPGASAAEEQAESWVGVSMPLSSGTRYVFSAMHDWDFPTYLMRAWMILWSLRLYHL